jgi:hypothetical protein
VPNGQARYHGPTLVTSEAASGEGLMEETPADRPEPPAPESPAETEPALTWAPYTGPGGAPGVAIYDADGNLLAGFHKQPGGGVLGRWNGGGTTLPDTGPKETGRITVPGGPAVWRGGVAVRAVSPAEERVVAAYIKTAEIIERLPVEAIEPLHVPVDETRDMLATILPKCNLMVWYVGQAELRRHGLI